MTDEKPPPKEVLLPVDWTRSTREELLSFHQWDPSAAVDVSCPYHPGMLRLTTDLCDWLRNPPSTEDDDQRAISFQAPIMAGEDQIATATLKPIIQENEWSLSLTIEW